MKRMQVKVLHLTFDTQKEEPVSTELENLSFTVACDNPRQGQVMARKQFEASCQGDLEIRCMNIQDRKTILLYCQRRGATIVMKKAKDIGAYRHQLKARRVG